MLGSQNTQSVYYTEPIPGAAESAEKTDWRVADPNGDTVISREFSVEESGSTTIHILVQAHDDRITKSYKLTVVRGMGVMRQFGDVGQETTATTLGGRRRHTSYNEQSLQFNTGRKWWGGAVDKNGIIWGIPHDQDRIMQVDSKNDSLVLHPPHEGNPNP